MCLDVSCEPRVVLSYCVPDAPLPGPRAPFEPNAGCFVFELCDGEFVELLDPPVTVVLGLLAVVVGEDDWLVDPVLLAAEW